MEEEISEEEIKKYTNYFSGEIPKISSFAYSRHIFYRIISLFILIFIIVVLAIIFDKMNFSFEILNVITGIMVVIFVAFNIILINNIERKEFAKVFLQRDRRIKELEKKLEYPRFFIWQPITEQELKNTRKKKCLKFGILWKNKYYF